jgi:ribonuclease HII
MKLPTCEFELKEYQNGFKFVVGCDEAGIGPLAGPVVAAAVIIKKDDLQQSPNLKDSLIWWSRVRDSKTVSEKERHALADLIKAKSFCYSVAVVSHETIDRINILNAALTAMKQSVAGLPVKPDYLLIDGKHILKDVNNIVQMQVVDGDAKVLSIAAASILAKVERDRIMNDLHIKYPLYGFDRHKGYPTKQHREAIMKHGPSPVHRKSFGIVKHMLVKPDLN